MLGYTAEFPASVLRAGQTAVTASAAALASSTIVMQVIVKASPDNAIPVYLGPSTVTTSTGFRLDPGESVTLEVVNLSAIYLIASTTGASVSWVAK